MELDSKKKGVSLLFQMITRGGCESRQRVTKFF